MLVRGTEIQVEGLDRIPEDTGAVLAGNHRCDLDPSIVMAVVPWPIAWLAAGYMARVPLVGWAQARIGAIHIGVDVQGRSYRQRAVDHLASGGLLGIFPEGHDYIVRNDFSAPMAPFHRGFAELARAASVPIVPFVIVPDEERLVPFKVPALVAKRSGWPEHVVRGMNQKVRYERVRVVFGEAIDQATSPSLEDTVEKTRNAVVRLATLRSARRAVEKCLWPKSGLRMGAGHGRVRRIGSVPKLQRFRRMRRDDPSATPSLPLKRD